jgi:pSer/pThr/pTyr-binding forkhead associated (FHA) protein
LTDIVVLNGVREGAVFALPDIPAVLGRSPEAHFHVDDPWISSMHAMFERRGEEYWVVDLDSRNGTFAGDERIREVRLTPGTLLRFGRTRVRVQERLERLDPAPPQEEAAGHGSGAAARTGPSWRETFRPDSTLSVSLPIPAPKPATTEEVIPLSSRHVALLRVALHVAPGGPAPASAEVRAALDGTARAALNEGGLAVRLAGSGVLALFGLTGPSSDDAARAVRAARTARATIRSLGAALDLRAAVEQGPVFAGNVGGPEGFELTALGEAADRVERVLALARPGEILAGPGAAGAAGSPGPGPGAAARVAALELKVTEDQES